MALLFALGAVAHEVARHPAIRALPGTASFSIYMIHMVIVYMIIHAFNKFVFPIESANDASIWALALACAPIAVFCSLLTYRYIEHPFIAKRNPTRAARPTAEPEADRRTATL